MYPRHAANVEDDHAFRTRLEGAKAASTVQLLFKAARLLNERAIAEARRRTNKPLRTAHTNLLPHLDLDGTRLTDLAARLEVSKQAAGQLIDELVEMGFVERAPDPTDARAKLVKLSAAGRAGIFQGLAVLKEIEADLRKEVGGDAMRTIHEALAVIVAAEESR